jgi:hypothetical protein
MQTPLVAQPSRRCNVTAHDLPHVPLRGVIGSGTTIVSVEQYGVYIGHCIVHPLFSMKTALIQEKKQASEFSRSVSIARKAL